MTIPAAPAGWFPDPQDQSQWRYWDGQIWTDHRAPRSQPDSAVRPLQAETAPAAKSGLDSNGWAVLAVVGGGGFLVVLVIVALLGAAGAEGNQREHHSRSYREGYAFGLDDSINGGVSSSQEVRDHCGNAVSTALISGGVTGKQYRDFVDGCADAYLDQFPGLDDGR